METFKLKPECKRSAGETNEEWIIRLVRLGKKEGLTMEESAYVVTAALVDDAGLKITEDRVAKIYETVIAPFFQDLLDMDSEKAH